MEKDGLEKGNNIDTKMNYYLMVNTLMVKDGLEKDN